MTKVLMLCLGNICRSPLAEGILRQMAKEQGLDMWVDSCGTASYHVGESPDHRSVKVAQKYGIDISNLAGRQLKPSDFEDFDHILYMDSSNFDNAKLKCPDPSLLSKLKRITDFSDLGINRIADPYLGDMHDFEKVYEQLSNACHGFIKAHAKK